MTSPDRTTETALPRRRFMGRMLALFVGAALPWQPRRAQAEVQGDFDPYVGEIKLFACNFPPRNWAFCQGQLLPINTNQALFSLLGTQYGGNGQTTFALPDLRSRVAIHQGQGPGLSPHTVGERAGEEAHVLTLDELPGHSHVARASSGLGGVVGPSNQFPARNAALVPQYGATADTVMAPGAIAVAGGGQPHENMQPYLALNYCIALNGIYPSQ